ncbi:MAG: hypothetical protein HY322_02995 [Betaproteobacteria bacterium]|nr:hypothetical protein [Betaproteobacteria bacterium]
MNDGNFLAIEGTTISEGTEAQFAGEILQSELLEESLESEPFAPLFASTSVHREPWIASDDLQMLWNVMWLTPMLSDEPVRRVSRGHGAEEVLVGDDPFERANRDRITLLARQYAAKDFSGEERARLEIVTERVRRLLPAVTVAEYESLARVLEMIKQAQESDAEIRRQLGINDKKKNG